MRKGKRRWMPALALTFWRHNSKRQLRKAEKLKRNLEFYIKDRVSITKKKVTQTKKQQLKAIANNKIIEIATTKLVAHCCNDMALSLAAQQLSSNLCCAPGTRKKCRQQRSQAIKTITITTTTTLII